jgi:signal transduction histidine kinase
MDPSTRRALGSSRVLAAAMRLFGERPAARRRAAERVALAVGRAHIRLGVKHVLAVVADALLREVDGRRAIFVVREHATGQLFVWSAGRLAGPEAEQIRLTRPQTHDVAPYFDAVAGAWSAVRGAHGWTVAGLDDAGNAAARPLAEKIAGRLQARRHVLGFRVARHDEWEGRLFLVDARVRWNRIAALETARHLVAQADTSLDNVYLLHRLRVRSASAERQRIARELHDGIIQSVMGVQIQLHALSARLTARQNPVSTELARLAAVLRDEALALREMMQRMQPPELDPEQLVDTIAATVKRFQHETGINSRFISNVDRIALPPRACREIAHVVQEALVNVRKHSDASQVRVSLTRSDGGCTLSIDDDGAGFPFTGLLTQHDAAYDQIGPRVIRERVRLIGGEISVVSAQRRGTAPSGARLTITIPVPHGYAIAG